ncbi:Hypothetical protein PFR_JS12-3_32, partial [Propionibacterium freudenreichii]
MDAAATYRASAAVSDGSGPWSCSPAWYITADSTAATSSRVGAASAPRVPDGASGIVQNFPLLVRVWNRFFGLPHTRPHRSAKSLNHKVLSASDPPCPQAMHHSCHEVSSSMTAAGCWNSPADGSPQLWQTQSTHTRKL